MASGRRGLRAVALVSLACALVLVSCSSNGSDGKRNDSGAAANRALQEGLQAHANGDLDAAERAYLETIRLDPENKYAYYNLGVIAQTQGDAETAISSYQTTIEIDPDFVPALFNLAILETDDDPDEARALYEHIIEVDDSYAAAFLNLGFLLIDQGREGQGQRMLDKAVERDPTLASRNGSDGQPVPGSSGGTGPTA
jgi:tetratricopeptide (TPR) repeat protein